MLGSHICWHKAVIDKYSNFPSRRLQHNEPESWMIVEKLWFCYKYYMVSPGTHLVNSQESLSITSESQLKNKESLIENAWYGPFNPTVNLETDTKTLNYSLLWSKYSPSIHLKHKKTKINIFKQQLQKSHKKDILPKNLQINRSSFASYGTHAMKIIILRLWGILRVRDARRRGNKITGVQNHSNSAPV